MEISYSGLLHAYANYKISKYLSAQINTEIYPLSMLSRRNRKFVKSFGFGITGEYRSMETLEDVEEDFSEYEFDKL